MTAAAPVTAFIALGANLDDPQQQLRDAIGRLAELAESRLVRSSSFYRADPVGGGTQPAYVNAVAELETRLPADALLAQLLAFEQEAGRVRREPGRHARSTSTCCSMATKRCANPVWWCRIRACTCAPSSSSRCSKSHQPLRYRAAAARRPGIRWCTDRQSSGPSKSITKVRTGIG